ncbi:MAG: hypothetical protein Q4B58_08465, partial [Bacteroidales bacterium]|nr:hypothetical protein [Bacteroidales bacterium]
MFISIDEFERISDIFAISAYFLFTGINAYRMFVHGRGHLQDVTAWLLVWWTILVFDKFIAYFFDHNTIDGAHAQTIYKCLANMVDMTCAVGCVMVAYTLSYVRRVTFLTVLTHASPYILCIISYLLTYDKLWMWVAFFWTIIYGLFYFFFFMSKFKAYTKRMKAAYSNDTSRNLDWL